VLFGAAVAVTRLAHAEAPTVTDTGLRPVAPERPQWSPANPLAPGVWPTDLPWQNTFLYLENSTTTQSVGVGTAYQSRNPYYELTLGLRPRFYLVQEEQREINFGADIGVTSERTNSDSTTKRGEWSATDFEFVTRFAYVLREGKDGATELDVRLPRVTLPTSKLSYDSGKILGVGARVLLAEDILLQGREAAFFPDIELGLRAEYGYQFTRAVEPSNSGLERLRIDPDGRAVVSDQLGGATFAAHSAVFGALAALYVHQTVLWSLLLDVRPAWHYPVRHDVEICGVVLTGCATPSGTPDPQTRSVVTGFTSDLLVTLNDVLGLSFGYANLTAQLGPDGRRRGVFYSPDARFYAQLNVGLDQLYVGVSQRSSRHARAGRGVHQF